MRQDYLSTSYLDQKHLVSERSETREIWIDPSNVCWDNLVSFWRHMMIFFSHLSLFYRWNILKIWENLSKWNMEVGPPICARVTFSTRVHYAHYISYMCMPFAPDVGDIRSAFIQFHIREAMRWLSHTWSGWDVFWEVHRITWIFSQKVWEILVPPLSYIYNALNVTQ